MYDSCTEGLHCRTAVQRAFIVWQLKYYMYWQYCFISLHTSCDFEQHGSRSRINLVSENQINSICICQYCMHYAHSGLRGQAQGVAYNIKLLLCNKLHRKCNAQQDWPKTNVVQNLYSNTGRIAQVSNQLSNFTCISMKYSRSLKCKCTLVLL